MAHAKTISSDDAIVALHIEIIDDANGKVWSTLNTHHHRWRYWERRGNRLLRVRTEGRNPVQLRGEL
jgi:hypothetical protein